MKNQTQIAQRCSTVLAAILTLCVGVKAADFTEPVAVTNLVFEERNGFVAVEAEHYFSQTLTNTRAWHLTSPHQVPDVKSDGDPPHLADASNGAYLEILPDTRRTHDDRLIQGENFSNQPGELAVLEYKIHFNNPGRYHVWVRAYSTGTEDNGLHVGLNGEWPASGQRMQWCDGKHSWRWENKQRTEQEHCGVPLGIFLDIPKEGAHRIQFSMREDGFEFDKFLLTTNRNLPRPEDSGPAPTLRPGVRPTAAATTAAPLVVGVVESHKSDPRRVAITQSRADPGRKPADVRAGSQVWDEVKHSSFAYRRAMIAVRP